MDKSEKRKINPIVAHFVACIRLALFAIRYGGTKAAWVNWTTGKVTPINE